MPAPSFRTRLLLAMMLVVGGVTLATAVATQRSLAAAYRRQDEERFARDLRQLEELREARLASVKARSRDLARSVRLVAALYERQPELLYQVALDELRDVLRPVEGGGRRAARFVRLVAGDATIPPPFPEPDLARDAATVERAIAAASRALTAGHAQEVGYLPLAIEGDPALHEVILTRIGDPVTQQALGALALGFPVGEDGGADAEADPVPTGIWVDGRLYTRTIPEAARPAVVAALTGAAGPDDETVVEVAGVAHRVFHRALQPGSGFPPAEQVGLYSMAASLARQRELTRRIAAIGAFALLAGLAVSLALSRGLAVPIRRLVAATAEVQQGNLAVRVPDGHDELGRLAASFNDMTAGLAEKERYRSALDLVADARVARQLLAGEVTLGGDEKDVSVLFCDIRGFTALTQDMDPADVIALLNEHMTSLTAVIHAHGGLVDKFVGDAVMAVWGAPQATGTEARDAVATALGIVAARERLNAGAREPLAIGVGIASGPVVAGCMGSTDRLNYTVLGERVNLAARLCASAGPMEVLIDEVTRARLGDTVRATALPPMQMKGFRDAIVVHRIARAEPGAA
jgi:class 3 adenylate cyclase